VIVIAMNSPPFLACLEACRRPRKRPSDGQISARWQGVQAVGFG